MRRSSSWDSLELIWLWIALVFGSLVFGRLTMLYMAEDPILIDKYLMLENTDDSDPVAVSCTDHGGKWPPPYRPIDITISLLVPHTEYNSKCLDFVVRIEYISENGEVAVTSWHPMTVKFRKGLMHYLLSLLRIVPFLSGISSDAPVVGLTSNGIEPSSTISCIRLTLQKESADFKGGVCVPQISAAHMLLQSQLPYVKRILWDWWYTMFICISMLPFGVGVICFRDVFIPRRSVRW